MSPANYHKDLKIKSEGGNLKNIGAYSSKEHTLTEEDTRDQVIDDVAYNLKEIFKHTDQTLNLFSSDYQDTEENDVYNLMYGKGAFKSDKVGTSDYDEALDRILNLYYPENSEGVRGENQNIKKWMQDEFGGGVGVGIGATDVEKAGWELLMDHFEVLDRLRDLDNIGKDPLEEKTDSDSDSDDDDYGV